MAHIASRTSRSIAKLPAGRAFFSKQKLLYNDPLLWKEQLSEEERMIYESTNAFCKEKLQPGIVHANRTETFDRNIMKEIGSMGLLGPAIQGYGCAGVNYVSYGIIANAIERVDSGYRSAMSVQSSLVMYPIYAYGTEEQKQKYLPSLARGDTIGKDTIDNVL
jgi:glutaryl-CoA dehydrogenase